MTGDYVSLDWKRNRTWPWPEKSWGLDPMFGEDGWCHSCGVPKHPQTGSLVLQRKGVKRVEGAWVPNWQFDVVCLAADLAATVATGFEVDLKEVLWNGVAPGDAQQLVIATVGDAWFDHDELSAAAIERHDVAGQTCEECRVWRWMPLTFGMLPPLRLEGGSVSGDIVASPEWFGDGWQAFRQILVRRELAELIAAASPRDFAVQEVDA